MARTRDRDKRLPEVRRTAFLQALTDVGALIVNQIDVATPGASPAAHDSLDDARAGVVQLVAMIAQQIATEDALGHRFCVSAALGHKES